MNQVTTHSNHVWKFFRAGGFDQVRLDSGADFANLGQLDKKLWVALACPTSGLEFDAKTLALLDSDRDGRIRALDIIAAVEWTCACLKNPDELVNGSSALPLASFNDSTAEGKQLLASAKQLLANLGKPEANSISLEDTTDTAKIFTQTHFNGDGIIIPDSAEDPAVKSVINDIMACFGSEVDRSGKPGINQAKVDQFLAEATAYSSWCNKAEANAALLPLGEAGTAEAMAAVETVKAKVDDYFARCRLAAFDPRAIGALNREEKEYLAFAAKDLTITSAEIAGFPLARVEAGRPLPLSEGVNPAWSRSLATLQSKAVQPLLGDKSSIHETDWSTLLAELAPYRDWKAGQVGASVQKLGIKRVREILAGKALEAIQTLINRDKAEEGNANAIAAVDKLVRYYRDLNLLCTNFVSFKDFYDRGEPAIFQAGRLYLDGRSCELCIQVEDMARHGAMAGLSRTYLAYCDCVRKSTNEKMTIAAAFTDGDSDNLFVGRNGVFYDRRGREWDATVVKIIENPISIRQAFWTPYKKLARFIEETIAKRATAADENATKKLTQAVTKTEKAATPVKGEEPKPKIDTGLITALAIGAAGVGGMLGGILTAFLGLGVWMPVGVVAILLLISGPSMILAWLKLRQRNLGPLLDANGWAVNAKARINIPFGTSLTAVAKLPPGAERNLFDPYAEKKRPWGLWLALLVLVALTLSWWQGKLDRYLPLAAKSVTVMGTKAPAYTPPAESPSPKTN